MGALHTGLQTGGPPPTTLTPTHIHPFAHSTHFHIKLPFFLTNGSHTGALTFRVPFCVGQSPSSGCPCSYAQLSCAVLPDRHQPITAHSPHPEPPLLLTPTCLLTLVDNNKITALQIHPLHGPIRSGGGAGLHRGRAAASRRRRQGQEPGRVKRPGGEQPASSPREARARPRPRPLRLHAGYSAQREEQPMCNVASVEVAVARACACARVFGLHWWAKYSPAARVRAPRAPRNLHRRTCGALRAKVPAVVARTCAGLCAGPRLVARRPCPT